LNTIDLDNISKQIASSASADTLNNLIVNMAAGVDETEDMSSIGTSSMPPLTLNVVSPSSINHGIDLGSIISHHDTIRRSEILFTKKNEGDLVTKEDRDKYQRLIYKYENKSAGKLSTTLGRSLRQIVMDVVVPNVKFIEFEHLDGLDTNTMIQLRSYPSFWEPDLLQNDTLQNDILGSYSKSTQLTLRNKCITWMMMRDKVLETIRNHRSNVQVEMKKDCVEGEF